MCGVLERKDWLSDFMSTDLTSQLELRLLPLRFNMFKLLECVVK